MKKILKQILCLSFFIVFIVSPKDVFANGFIDTNNKSTLNIYHSYEDRPLSDVKFSIYHIADVTETCSFEVSDKFKDYPIDFNSINDSTEWYVLADTLANYIKTDRIPADYIMLTDSEGKATLSDLNVGLYLSIAEPASIDNKTIQTKPFLVSLPNIDEEYNIWTYDITVNTKTDEDINENMNLVVEKLWENTESDSAPPTSITVGLYRNDKQYDTAVLSENNNWKYSWSNLSKNYEWTVKELQVPPNYTDSYEVYDSNITITNTYQGEDIGGEQEEIEDNKDKEQSKLPVTGAIIGSTAFVLLATVLIVVGYIFIRKKK